MSGVAFAADVYEGGLKDTPVYEPAPSFAGFYIGGHVGVVKDVSDPGYSVKEVGPDAIQDDFVFQDPSLFSFSGIDKNTDVELIGGVHAGYNWQWGQKVFGIEADASFSDFFDYLASVRARLGYASGGVLLYVTGGVAFAGLDDSSFDVNFSPKGALASGPAEVSKFSRTVDSDDTNVGWVVGGGLEWLFKPGWSFGVEGLFYKFEDVSKTTVSFQDIEAGEDVGRFGVFTQEDDAEFWTVRARLTYHFGGAEPVEPLK